MTKTIDQRRIALARALMDAGEKLYRLVDTALYSDLPDGSSQAQADLRAVTRAVPKLANGFADLAAQIAAQDQVADAIKWPDSLRQSVALLPPGMEP